jgi:hypothetical protein
MDRAIFLTNGIISASLCMCWYGVSCARSGAASYLRGATVRSYGMSVSEMEQCASSVIAEETEALSLTPEEAGIVSKNLASAARKKQQLDIRITERPKPLDTQIIDWHTY